MNKKIVHKFFHYADQTGATNFMVSSLGKKIILDYSFPGGDRQSFSLPPDVGQDLLAGLRQILHLKPGELVNSRPARLISSPGHFDFQMTVVPDKNREKIIISLQNKEQTLWRLNQLGCQSDQLKDLKNFLRQRSGLLIASSPAGQGRSTTALALAEALISEDKNIYVLEDDPVVSRDGLNFLKQTPTNWSRVLNHDSDIIMADPLDKPENLANAIRAAASGRLVIGTLTAASSFEVLALVLKLSLPLKLKLDNLKMIINQRLADLNHSIRPANKNKRQTIGLFEILKITPELKKALTPDANLNNQKFWTKLINQTIATGWQPLEFDRQKKRKITKK
jgi:type II secretory ATPase GspE/PulE/Tfp pilus assembly ATPase PilB-like protein